MRPLIEKAGIILAGGYLIGVFFDAADVWLRAGAP